VNDNTDVPTGIDLSFTMDLSDLRSLGSFEYSPEARTILERNTHLLLMAPMVAFFRRFPDRVEPIYYTHRIMALSLDFRIAPITQRSRQVVEEVWAWLLLNNPRLVSLGWAQLSPVQQAYLLNSALLPIEFKSQEYMDAMPAEDFALVMTQGISWEPRS
jgi:hypothetical protein